MKHKHHGHDGHHKHHHDGHHMRHEAHKGHAHRGAHDEVEPKSWGHGEHANMPKEVVMSDYPRGMYGDSVRFMDDINRLQDDAHSDQQIKRRNVNRGMY